MDELSVGMVDIARQLEAVWQDAVEYWHDSTTDYFEQNYWWPLAEAMSAYIDAVRALEEVLSAADTLTSIDYHT